MLCCSLPRGAWHCSRYSRCSLCSHDTRMRMTPAHKTQRRCRLDRRVPHPRTSPPPRLYAWLWHGKRMHIRVSSPLACFASTRATADDPPVAVSPQVALVRVNDLEELSHHGRMIQVRHRHARLYPPPLTGCYSVSLPAVQEHLGTRSFSALQAVTL